MGFSFDVVGSMFEFSAKNQGDLCAQRGFAEFGRQPLDVTRGNFPHLGLAE
jgi:hypothetical protein